ncbi:hypothetical protein LCGC14_2635750, partial [marine sediment metagenome]
MKELLVALVVVIVATMGVAATVCPEPTSIDPNTLDFPVDPTLIQNRLIGSISLQVGQTWTKIIGACDADDDPLEFAVTNMPTGMTFDPNTLILNWAPMDSQKGTAFYLNVHVEDKPNENPNNVHPPGTMSKSDDGTVVV